jgi:uncharacterized protein
MGQQAMGNTVNMPRVAVIGSGVAGLSAAWHLKERTSVTLFESDGRAGGHAHTVDVTVGGKTFGVDTGFLVFNHRTYPGITPFFDDLGVETAKSDMGFSVQASNAGHAPIEWAGNGLNSVFTQRKNLLKPAFWAMLRDIVRFNTAATAYALKPDNTHETLGEYLQTHRYSDALCDWYLVPMAAAIWSCPTATMMGYPMATFARFCHNHGLLQIANRPQWFTVQGGSRNYVNKVLTALPDVRLSQAVTHVERHTDKNKEKDKDKDKHGVIIHTASSSDRFDAVVIACHSDQALRMVSPSAQEAALLGAISYQANTAVLHTDASLLPSHRRAWAAWNYETRQSADAAHSQQQVCLHYLLNKLQPLPVSDAHPVIVSLNPLPEHMPHPDTVIQTFEYAHPVFNTAAIAAQRELPRIQGDQTGQRTWFAGAWTNYGFHEDGFQSGKAAALGVLHTLNALPLSLSH